jgi:hypothetical protein
MSKLYIVHFVAFLKMLCSYYDEINNLVLCKFKFSIHFYFKLKRLINMKTWLYSKRDYSSHKYMLLNFYEKEYI